MRRNARTRWLADSPRYPYNHGGGDERGGHEERMERIRQTLGSALLREPCHNGHILISRINV